MKYKFESTRTVAGVTCSINLCPEKYFYARILTIFHNLIVAETEGRIKQNSR